MCETLFFSFDGRSDGTYSKLLRGYSTFFRRTVRHSPDCGLDSAARPILASRRSDTERAERLGSTPTPRVRRSIFVFAFAVRSHENDINRLYPRLLCWSQW